MIIYNSFAAAKLNDPKNIDQYLPVSGPSTPDVTEDYEETDGKVVLVQKRYYNTANELYLISKFSVLDPPALTSLAAGVDSYLLSGSNLSVDSQLFLEYIPDPNMWFGANQVSGPSGITKGFRYLLTSTYVYPNEIGFVWDVALNKQLKEGGNYPRLMKGRANLVYQDLLRELEVSLLITVTEADIHTFSLSS